MDFRESIMADAADVHLADMGAELTYARPSVAGAPGGDRVLGYVTPAPAWWEPLEAGGRSTERPTRDARRWMLAVRAAAPTDTRRAGELSAIDAQGRGGIVELRVGDLLDVPAWMLLRDGDTAKVRVVGRVVRPGHSGLFTCEVAL